MSIITRMRKQSAVWWERTGTDDGGDPTFATPIQIACRWVDEHEEFIDPKGTRRISDSIVNVDREMTVGDLLRLGDFEFNLIRDNPFDNTGVGEIKQFTNLPNLRNTESLLTAML